MHRALEQQLMIYMLGFLLLHHLLDLYASGLLNHLNLGLVYVLLQTLDLLVYRYADCYDKALMVAKDDGGGSEDCLYLDVYVPRFVPDLKNASVMVWLYPILSMTAYVISYIANIWRWIQVWSKRWL